VLRHRLGDDTGTDSATPTSEDGGRFFSAGPTLRADSSRANSARMLDLVGGRRPARDRSTDSSASGGSAAVSGGSRHVSFTGAPTSAPHAALSSSTVDTQSLQHPVGSPALSLDGSTAAPSEGAGSSVAGDAIAPPSPQPLQPVAAAPTAAGGPLAAPASAAVESMRSLGSSLNPLSQFAKMGLFGRAAPAAGPPSPAAAAAAAVTPTSVPAASSPLGIVGLGAPFAPGSGSATPPAAARAVSAAEARTLAAVDEARGAPRPRGKFVDCRDARELRVGEVEELLAEYKRLAGLLGKVLAP
jgi:hypothetical protein